MSSKANFVPPSSSSTTSRAPASAPNTTAPASVSVLDLALPSRPAFALPPRPSLQPSNRPRGLQDSRSRSPSPTGVPSFRQRNDVYHPPSRSRSPSPLPSHSHYHTHAHRREADSYVPREYNYDYSPRRRRYSSSPSTRSYSHSHSRSRSPVKRDYSTLVSADEADARRKVYEEQERARKRQRSTQKPQQQPERAGRDDRSGRSLLERLALKDAPSGTRLRASSPPRQRSPPADMPGPSRGGGRSRGNARPARSAPRANQPQFLPGPMMNKEWIMETYGSMTTLKPQWAENPKAPLANYVGGGTGGSQDFGQGSKSFSSVEGMVDGQRVFRVSVVGDAEQGITGVADDKVKKEAEKLAALSAVLQLSAAGLLDGRRPGKAASGAATPAAAGESIKISDGTTITYDRARQFMEYYCQRYRFGKPDIDYSQSTARSKRGKSASAWDAVITVGGRRIGMGSANSKKAAQIKCYLDVTQYLESCDPDLWRDFVEVSAKDPSANIGLAPHLYFQMSDELNEDVQGLCGDLRGSTLVKSAPPSGAAVADQALPTWAGARMSVCSEEELQRKSDALLDKLHDYANDPRLAKMREQRASLPVTARATDLLAKIEVNDVTIVMAATGSGKTTQIPQLLFDDYIRRGEGAKCNIVCTQPRRLAAMSVAERIADERGDPLGREVGYQVRFDSKLPQPNGSITFCTTGIFLKRMQSALGQVSDTSAVRSMDQVTHIVVDEVHERDIDTDLSLVVLKRLLADRKTRGVPIKIILMSATIDGSLFQRYFADSKGRLAPIAEVPGRTFPVERHYLDETVRELRKGLPMQMGGWVFGDKDVAKYLDSELSPNRAQFSPNTGMDLTIPYPLVALITAYVMQRSEDGHVLVFLPGWDEIKKVADVLLNPSANLLGVRFSDSSKYSVHYLHSTIPAAEQKEVFRPPPPGVRRVILATNIAETSVTIPDVVYVVDTGRVKEKRYDPERHMSSLVSAWVGSSNLNQRAGRAGRHREGEYYGLVSNNRLDSLDTHQLVEMKRSDLSNVVMHVKALNLGEVEEVLAAAIEPPEPMRIVSAMQMLRMLGALDSYKNLTALGRVLLQLPVEAAIGKLCLYGSFFRCLDSALTLAAVLTNRDPFLAPIDKKAQADEIKDSWSPAMFRSDPLAIVAAYNVWNELDDAGRYSQANMFCSENFLSKPTLLQIKQVKGSLLQSLDQAGVIAVSAGGNIGRLGRRGYIPPQLNEHGKSLPLLAALIAMACAPNFALRTSERTCRTAQDKTVMIHNASVNSRKRETNSDDAPFNPAEKRLYAFSEKARNVSPGQNPNSAMTQLRNVTRLDPMTYMLFGAYELVVTQRGLECDAWLPVTGNLHALDDVQRLKSLLEAAMLRVFEGVGKALTRGRDQRWVNQKAAVDVRGTSSRINEPTTGTEEEGENESDDEGDGGDGTGNGNGNGNGSAAAVMAAAAARKRVVDPLSTVEIQELEMLTTDVVRILDAYAAEREGQASKYGSRVASRAATPSFYSGAGFGISSSGPGPGQSGGVGGSAKGMGKGMPGAPTGPSGGAAGSGFGGAPGAYVPPGRRY